MKTHFARIALLLGLTVTAFAAENAPPRTTPKPVARIENASDSFPLSLQGLFGKDGKPEVSLRDKTTGKSAWLKPGDSFGGWKLESVDVKSGLAVLTQGGRRLALRQAGEMQAETDSNEKSVAQKLESRDESVVWKKLKALKGNDLAANLSEKSKDLLRKSHPEFFGKDGQFYDEKPGAIIAQAAEMKRLLDADSTPEADAARPLLTAMFDAVERTQPLAKPLPSESTRAELDAEQAANDKQLATPMSDEKRAELVAQISSARMKKHDQLRFEKRAEIVRIYEEADRIYLERNGGK